MKPVDKKVKETLEKQLKLLSERAEECNDTSELLLINHAINETLQIILLLCSQNRLQRGARASQGQSLEQTSKEN